MPAVLVEGHKTNDSYAHGIKRKPRRDGPVSYYRRMRIYLALLIFVLLSTPALAQPVVDGDTLFVGRLKYRLCGIDAPERNEPGYRQATEYLRKLVKGKTIKCTPVGQGTPCDGRSKPRSYDRIVAQCFVDGKDLAREMVRAGYVKDWPKFSGGYYSR